MTEGMISTIGKSTNQGIEISSRAAVSAFEAGVEKFSQWADAESREKHIRAAMEEEQREIEKAKLKQERVEREERNKAAVMEREETARREQLTPLPDPTKAAELQAERQEYAENAAKSAQVMEGEKQHEANPNSLEAQIAALPTGNMEQESNITEQQTNTPTSRSTTPPRLRDTMYQQAKDAFWSPPEQITAETDFHLRSHHIELDLYVSIMRGIAQGVLYAPAKIAALAQTGVQGMEKTNAETNAYIQELIEANPRNPFLYAILAEQRDMDVNLDVIKLAGQGIHKVGECIGYLSRTAGDIAGTAVRRTARLVVGQAPAQDAGDVVRDIVEVAAIVYTPKLLNAGSNAVKGMSARLAGANTVSRNLQALDLTVSEAQVGKYGASVAKLRGEALGKTAEIGELTAQYQNTTGRALADVAKDLDYSMIRGKAGHDAMQHIEANHFKIQFNKPKQDMFYSDNPIKVVDDSWAMVRELGIKPVTDRGADIYVVPCNAAGYTGGYGGQLKNLDYITIITKTGTNKVITAFPSGKTPPLPQDYVFKFGEN